MTDPLRIAIIGFGTSGRLIHRPLIDAMPGLTLAAVATSRPGEASAIVPGAAIFTDPARMLNESSLDLVVVATGNDSHAHWARQGLAAGKNMLIEKPFALSLPEAQEISDIAEQQGLAVSVFQNRRYDSDFLTVRSLIESGAVGRVHHFESHYVRYSRDVQPQWRAPAAPGAGAWLDLGAHLVDQALQLFGLPQSVWANFAAVRPGCECEDSVLAVLTYAGHRVVLHSSFAVAGGSSRFIVHGADGSILKSGADRQGRQLVSGMLPGAAGWGEDPAPAYVIDADGMQTGHCALAGDYRRFYAAMEAFLRGSGGNPTPAPDIIAVMKVLDAGARSARTGHAEYPGG